MKFEDNNFEKFTKEAKQALVVAQEKAKEAKLNYVGTEHVLIGILSQQQSLGALILANFGVSLENVYLVLKTVGRVTPPQVSGQKNWGGLTGFAKKVIEDAARSAHMFNHTYIGTEHLLLALVNQENTAATVILENMKVNPRDVKEQIVKTFEKNNEVRNSGQAASATMPPMNPFEMLLSGLSGAMMDPLKDAPYKSKQSSDGKKSKTPALDYFTTDLIAECKQNKIGPVIGRNKEIERAISILCRKTKNNPVFIGEPGTGKTAIVEGLAKAIVEERVPDILMDKKILSLSMASVVAGTKYRGEFEERIKQIIDEASGLQNIILFIDELHTVIGAGSAEGSLDASNILKPALSRGKIQMIGATTLVEYRKHIETDAAFERRFQPVKVEESTEEDTIKILEGLRESFEEHHNLIITDEAIVAAVKMSKRYINDRFLPDKAIDLIDEASAVKRISTKGNSDHIKSLQNELAKVIKDKELSVAQQDYEHALNLRNRELELIKIIEEQKTIKIPRENRAKVEVDDVARVIARMTGVEATKLIKGDVERLIGLESALKTKVIGQDEAVMAVSKAIRRSRVGISDHNRPIGSFLFLGPTGVGKTELVKVLAKEFFNDKNALIKIDMSEFMERHNTSRLVGATAGYVGYEEGGQLTEAVRRRPYAIVLFDEIEKAHPDVFNLLLQILEDGVLTDAKGRAVDFKNTIIVMTSNIGAKKLTEKAAPIGFHLTTNELEQAEMNYERLKEEVIEELKKQVRPEFLNRIDKTIVFKPLTNQAVKEIVKINLDALNSRLLEKSMMITFGDEVLDYLATESFSTEFGARPVRRKIQELVEDQITEGVLNGKFSEGEQIDLILKDGKLLLEKLQESKVDKMHSEIENKKKDSQSKSRVFRKKRG